MRRAIGESYGSVCVLHAGEFVMQAAIDDAPLERQSVYDHEVVARDDSPRGDGSGVEPQPHPPRQAEAEALLDGLWPRSAPAREDAARAGRGSARSWLRQIASIAGPPGHRAASRSTMMSTATRQFS
jgi:hypothetical protein